jgi:hypothetical protein
MLIPLRRDLMRSIWAAWVNLVGRPPHPHDVRLRHVMSGCNRVVSQCEMAGASGWVNNAPTAGTFRVGRREARSLSERWPADPLLARHRLRFKAIDARLRGSRALPLNSGRRGGGGWWWCRSRQYRKQYGKIGGVRRGILRETISVPPSNLGRCRIVPTQRPFLRTGSRSHHNPCD